MCVWACAALGGAPCELCSPMATRRSSLVGSTAPDHVRRASRTRPALLVWRRSSVRKSRIVIVDVLVALVMTLGGLGVIGRAPSSHRAVTIAIAPYTTGNVSH